MNKRLFIIIAAFFLTALSQPCWSLSNPVVRNPVGRGNVPPSIRGQGMISSPNPVDTSGNLLITGNVRGGTHFRAEVPYRSAEAFGGQSAQSLWSFRRYSAGIEDIGSFAGKYRQFKPFFEPMRTVTTSASGISPLYSQRTMGIGIGAAGGSSLAETSETQFAFGRETAFSNIRMQPMMRSPLELEKLILAEVGGYTAEFPQSRIVAEGQIGQTLPGLVSEQRPVKLGGGGTTQLSTSPGISADQPAPSESGVNPLQPYPERINDKATDLNLSLKAGDLLRDTREVQTGITTNSRLTEGIRPQPKTQAPTYQDYSVINRLQTVQEQSSQVGTTERRTRLSRREQELLESSTALPRYEEVEGFKNTVPSRNDWSADFYKRLREYIDNFQKNQEQKSSDESELTPPLPPASRDAEGEEQSSPTYTKPSWETGGLSTRPLKGIGQEDSYLETLRKTSSQESLYTIYNRRKTSSLTDTNIDYGQGSYTLETSKAPGEVGLQTDLSARAARILGPYKNYDSYAKDKFERFLKAAEVYLKQGRYYRAVDAYNMASIYRSDEPAVNVGKSHALFAAGEYMSSALFLSRALEAHPEYAQVKVDLEATLGGRDNLDSRIANAEQWLKNSDAVEMQFLLGYIYYQMGSLGHAKEAIDAAYKEVPDSPAVGALKKAIDSAMAGSQAVIK